MSVYIYTEEEASDAPGWIEVIGGLAVKEEPGPEVPAPVWDSRPIRGEACVAATKALCG
jgi:hypothetical protein